MSSGFKWTQRRSQAAQLVADDHLIDEDIAAKVGISSKQLVRWKKQPEFAAKVDELVAEFDRNVRLRGIAVRARRIESYLADWDHIQTILRERGAELAEISGGKTGYIVRDYKGKDADTPVYAFDAALFREARALREQLAKELGQWTDKSRVDTTVTSVEVTRDALRKLSHEELVEYERLLSKVTAPDQIVETTALPAATEPEK
jgi:hypothetical protein